MEKARKQSLAIVLSFVIHGLVIAFLLLSDRFITPTTFYRRQTEVELIEPEKLLAQLKAARKLQDDKLQGQIVEQDEKAINDERDENSKFLSRHNQKVVRETQAAVHGRFRNTDGTAGQKAEQKVAGQVKEKRGVESDKDQEIARKGEKATKLVNSNDGIATKSKPQIKDLMPSFKPGPPPSESTQEARGGGEGASATDDHIKNVATGMQTLLSTREFVYYSYYNRIKDKLRQYWEPKIKEKMEHLLRQGRTIASTTERITRIVIVLDDNGTLLKVQIIGPSGVSDLDDAAAEAFRAAAPFPHPPKGIVDADGTIKIRWDFILEAGLDFDRVSGVA